MASLHETPLMEQAPEYWVNTILYRLAEALGYEGNEDGFWVDPDEILDEAVGVIESHQAHYCE